MNPEQSDDDEAPTIDISTPPPNVFPIDVVYVDNAPRHVEVEARTHHGGDTHLATYRFRLNDGTAKLERIETPADAYYVPENAEGRAAVRDSVDDLPFVDDVVMFDD